LRVIVDYTTVRYITHITVSTQHPSKAYLPPFFYLLITFAIQLKKKGLYTYVIN